MRRFGLIGKTLKHSFSKTYFENKFAREGIAGCRYDNFELASIDDLPGLIGNTKHLAGLNITIPYKEAVLPFLDFKNEIVQHIGACNCIKIVGDQLHGFNTDAIAFEQSLRQHLRPFHRLALVLGSGGASKAVQYALKKLDIEYLVASRQPGINHVAYDQLGPDQMRDHHIIINTTPVGMYPDVGEQPPLPYHLLSPEHLLYDLTYNPPKTRFLEAGEQAGSQIINGYEMLAGQAEESWRIWNSAG